MLLQSCYVQNKHTYFNSPSVLLILLNYNHRLFLNRVLSRYVSEAVERHLGAKRVAEGRAVPYSAYLGSDVDVSEDNQAVREGEYAEQIRMLLK